MQALLTNDHDSFLHRFDVRAKLSVSIICAFSALMLSSIESLALLFVATMIYALLMNRIKILVVSYFFMVLMMGLSLLCVLALSGIFKNLSSQGLNLTSAIVPFIRGASAMNAVLPLALTIRIQTLLTSLQSFRLPFMLYLPAAVMIRFISSFISDVKQIGQSIKIRGFKLSIKNILLHPRIFLRLTFSPLVFLTLRTSDDLGIAAELKGLGMCKKSNFKITKFKRHDYALVATALIISAICIYIQIQLGGQFFKGMH